MGHLHEIGHLHRFSFSCATRPPAACQAAACGPTADSRLASARYRRRSPKEGTGTAWHTPPVPPAADRAVKLRQSGGIFLAIRNVFWYYRHRATRSLFLCPAEAGAVSHDTDDKGGLHVDRKSAARGQSGNVPTTTTTNTDYAHGAGAAKGRGGRIGARRARKACLSA